MKTTNLPLPILSDLETTTEADSEDSNIPPPAFPQLPHPHLQQQRHHAHYGHHSHFHHPTKVACQSNTGCAGGNHIPATVTTHTHCATKLPTIYSGPPTTSENNTESDSDEVDDDDLEEESSSECGECCGGHAPYPTLVTRAPNIIPATMCKSTQISPTTVIEMYAAAASIRRRNTNIATSVA